MRNTLRVLIDNLKAKRHDARVMAFAIGVFIFGSILLVLLASLIFAGPTRDTTGVLPGSSNTASATVALPATIRIPKINLTASFEEPVGLRENGEIEVPDSYETVSYYTHGPRPGELGPSVVLGHVDSKDGPAIFWSLGELTAGDEIVIERADGTSAVFEVTRLERHEQSGFPTEKVYGDIDHAGLRLITCSGTYQRDVERYTHNLIVFAELVSE